MSDAKIQTDSSFPKVRVGFLGAGRMAQAIAFGFVASGLVEAKDIIFSATGYTKLKALAEKGFNTTLDNNRVVANSDMVVLAVKPHILPGVMKQVSSSVTDKHLLVSVAAGTTIATMEGFFPPNTRLIRTMPNTPSLVQCGATIYSPGTHATDQDCLLIEKLFKSIGTCDKIPETMIDSATGLSGSGPAYMYMAIEALADGGVKMGVPRELAQRMAAQVLMGAAKMVLETGEHPGALKDAVCSPGGTTIAAVHKLEQGRFRSSLIEAVEASSSKAREFSKK